MIAFLMENDRLITLRRPPVVHVETQPWVPDRVDSEVVDSCWAEILDHNPKAFDGRVLHVIGVHRNGAGGVSIHVAECAYRYYAVQTTGLDCGVRTLGAKAITRSGDRILMGLRSDWVMYYPKLWEFVPGGSVVPGQTPTETIIEEMHEETGLNVSRPPVPVAVAYDSEAYSWEVIHLIELDEKATPVGSREYDELRWSTRSSLPEDLTPIARRMTSLI